MNRASGRRLLLATLIGVNLLTGCESRSPIGSVTGPRSGTLSAKASSVTVTAASPDFGDVGQVNVTVTITGTGFRPGAQMAMLLNGVLDTTVTVSSTQYVSSTQLVSVVGISPKSPVAFRDVQVLNADRTKGIGYSKFEVTNAIIATGTMQARAVNDNGEIAGTVYVSGTSGTAGVGYFATATGTPQNITSSGTGFKISPLGNAISAHAFGSGTSTGFPYLFTRSGPVGSSWQATALPIGATTDHGGAQALAADPVTGQVVLLGGKEYIPSGQSLIPLPIVWRWQAATSSWQRLVLPLGTAASGEVRAVSVNGRVAGVVTTPSEQAAVWEPDGSGGYVLTVLTSSAHTNGMNGAGTLIVGSLTGKNSSGAAYWTRSSGGVWSAATTLPGGCAEAIDVANTGRIALHACAAGSGSNWNAAFIDPPYSAPVRLGGLGPSGSTGLVSGISPSGQYITAQGTQSTASGIYWRLY